MLRYIVICYLLTTVRSQISDEFDLLLDSLDSIANMTSVHVTEIHDDGDTFYEFNKKASIPLSRLAFRNKTLHYPFIINTVFNLYEKRSALFYINDLSGKTKLGLTFQPNSRDLIEIGVYSRTSFPEPITFTLRTDDFSTHKRVNLLLYIRSRYTTLWLNCKAYGQVHILTYGDIVLSKLDTLHLSQSYTDEIMGAIKEIKIHTNADQTTINTICEPETKGTTVAVPVDIGDVGPTGPPEPPGPTGPVGERGLTGETGAKGEQGDKGHKGAEGPRGDKGERGEAGVDGIPGTHGTHGRPGEIGQKGDKGETGATGPAGMPATLTSLLNEDLDSIQNAAIMENLRGLKGRKGDDGKKGDIGDEGPMGPHGTDGKGGRDGAPGERGPIGPKGDVGPIGPRGHKGNSGEPGPPGNVPTSTIALLKGHKGVEGEKGAPGVKGEKGNSAPPIDLSLLKGDKGERGDIGPIGPIGPSGPPGAVGNQTSLPGPPGPPGPPGTPGVSIIGPKGEPATISNSGFHDFESLGEGDDVYTAATLVYKNITALIRRTSSTPLGTLAFVLQEKILLLRVQNGWQYVMMGSLYGDVPDSTPTTVEPTLATRAQTPVETSARPRRERLTSNVLRLIALNEPYTGIMMSMTNVSGTFAVNNDNCTRQSRNYNFSGSYEVLFNYRNKGIQYLVRNSYRHLPVVNLYGDVLFDSWNSLVDGLGGVLPTAANIFSFNGKNVFIDSTWPDKKIWHGGNTVNVRQTVNCKDWTSASHKEYGVASPLESNKLLQQEIYPCDSQFIVLCIESAPSVPSDRTSEATEAYAVGQEDEEN